MSTVLTQLFNQVKPEHIAQLETPELAEAFLIALGDWKDIYPSQIINAEGVKSALGYESRNYPPRPSPISDSDGDKLPIALMAA